MQKDKYSAEWIEGFAKEAEAMGLDAEQAKQLLKAASIAQLSEDEDFKKGYEGIMKEAGLGSFLLKALKTPVGASAATALGLGIPWYISNYVSPYFNQSPEMRRHQMSLRNLKGESLADYMSDFAKNRRSRIASDFRRGRDEMKSIYDDGGRRTRTYSGWGAF